MGTASRKFAETLEHFLQRSYSDNQSRMIELVRRTKKGEYEVQFFGKNASRLREALGTRKIALPSFGSWSVGVAVGGGVLGPSISVVVPRVPLSMSSDEFIDELKVGNDGRFDGFHGADFQASIRSAFRLSRRMTDPSGSRQWTPSQSMRIVVSKALGEAMLARGSIVLQFRPVEVRPFHPLVRTCFKCGQEGHEARFCRSAPRCRNCGKGHAVRECTHLRRGSASAGSERAPSPMTGCEEDTRGSVPPKDTCW